MIDLGHSIGRPDVVGLISIPTLFELFFKVLDECPKEGPARLVSLTPNTQQLTEWLRGNSHLFTLK